MLYYLSSPNLDDLMYDDYDLEYASYNDANLDEDMYLPEDEEYDRDPHGYEDLARRHYA